MIAFMHSSLMIYLISSRIPWDSNPWLFVPWSTVRATGRLCVAESTAGGVTLYLTAVWIILSLSLCSSALQCCGTDRGFKVSLVSWEVNYTPAAPGCSSSAVPLLLFSSSDGASGASGTDAFGKLAGNLFAPEFLTQTVGLLLLMAIW